MRATSTTGTGTTAAATTADATDAAAPIADLLAAPSPHRPFPVVDVAHLLPHPRSPRQHQLLTLLSPPYNLSSADAAHRLGLTRQRGWAMVQQMRANWARAHGRPSEQASGGEQERREGAA
jgi:hypothetical protein